MTNKKSAGSKRFSLTGFIKLTRVPNLLIIAFTQYFAAIFLVDHPNHELNRLFDVRLFLLVLSTSMIAAAGYIINDYYDIKIDYVNKPEKVVVGKLIKRRIVLVSHSVLNFLGILIGFYLGFYIGVINLTAAFLLWLYSNRLKRLPFIGNLLISVLTGLSLITIAVLYRKNADLLVCYATFAFSITLIREIIKDMEDIRGDMRFGSETLPIIWGFRKTKMFLYFLIGTFMALFVYLADYLDNAVLNNFFLILIFPILYLIYLLYQADTQRKFFYLSVYCKIIMLAGILSMVFF